MKRMILIALLLSFALPSQAYDTACEATACFSPKGGCEAAIVTEIDKAQKEVLVLAYSFTSVPICDALIRARTNGVAITVIVDKRQSIGRYSLDERLTAAGITVRYDSAHAIMHDKVMLIDNSVLITGSYNFTKAAELRNAENLLIFKPACSLHIEYRKDFERHLRHSR